MFYFKTQKKLAKALAEAAIQEVTGKSCFMLLESEDEGAKKVRAEVEDCAEDAKKAEEFVKKNKQKYEATLKKVDGKHKPLYKRAWDFLCYAVGKGTKFVLDHIVEILKLIAIIAIGFFCFPLLEKLWQYIEDALNKSNERKTAYDKATDSAKFQEQREKENVATFTSFLDDPDKINQNLPKGWEKRKDLSIQFVKNLSSEEKEKIKAWIMVNDIGDKKLNVLGGAAGDIVLAVDNALSPLEHAIRRVNGNPTSLKTHKAEMHAQERQINYDVLPVGRSIAVLSSIPSKKTPDGSLDMRRWNFLMKQIDAWDKAGRPSVTEKQTGSRRVQVDRDNDPGVKILDRM